MNFAKTGTDKNGNMSLPLELNGFATKTPEVIGLRWLENGVVKKLRDPTRIVQHIYQLVLEFRGEVIITPDCKLQFTGPVPGKVQQQLRLAFDLARERIDHDVADAEEIEQKRGIHAQTTLKKKWKR